MRDRSTLNPHAMTEHHTRGTVKASAAAQKKLVRGAMDTARDELHRMIRWLSLQEKKPEEAAHRWATSLAIAALKTPDGDKLASNSDVVSRSPVHGRVLQRLPPGTSREVAISSLKKAPPPRQPKAGRRSKTS